MHARACPQVRPHLGPGRTALQRPPPPDGRHAGAPQPVAVRAGGVDGQPAVPALHAAPCQQLQVRACGACGGARVGACMWPRACNARSHAAAGEWRLCAQQQEAQAAISDVQPSRRAPAPPPLDQLHEAKCICCSGSAVLGDWTPEDAPTACDWGIWIAPSPLDCPITSRVSACVLLWLWVQDVPQLPCSNVPHTRGCQGGAR